MKPNRMLSHALRPCLVALAAVLCCCALCACATDPVVGTSNNDKTSVFQSSEATFTPQDVSITSSRTGEALEITSQGWNAKDGFVHYGIMVENPNTDLIARNTVVKVRLYDKKGKLMSEDESTIMFVGPGKTIGYAGNKAGDGTKPAKVKIALDEDSTVWQDAQDYTDPFTIDDFTDKDALYRRYQISGDITNHTGEYASTVPLSFVLFDEDDKVVGGYVGEAYRIKAGRTKSFKATINTVPDYDHMEVYPQIYVEGKMESASNSSYY